MNTTWLTVTMHFNGSIRSRTFASKFFELFNSIYPELDFELMGEWEPPRTKFDRFQSLIEWERNRGTAGKLQGRYIFLGKKPHEFYALPHWHGEGDLGWTDSVSVMFSEGFGFPDQLGQSSSKAVELLKGLAQIDTPLYGKAHVSSEWESKNFKEYPLPRGGSARESISITPLQGVIDLYWANYFGKPYVRIFGEESVEKVESPVKQRVGDGLMLVFSEHPSLWDDKSVRELQERAKAILNHGVFYDRLADRKPVLDIQSQPL